MKSIRRVVYCLSIVFMLCLLGCGKDKTTTIYGVVINHRTGNPMANLQVSVGYFYGIRKPIASTVTGSDGLYELTFYYDDNYGGYFVSLSNGGIADYHDVVINKGEMNRFDFVY